MFKTIPPCLIGALLVAGTAACVSSPPPRPVALDPSNPEAPEAPRPVLAVLGPEAAPTTAVASPAPAPTPAPSPAPAPPPAPATPPAPAPRPAPAPPPAPPAPSDKAPAATVYTCPMHPEVVSDKPGRCPKCGMKLVPKETTAPTPAPGAPR